MQRPERFAEREFMTVEEVEEMRARLAARDAASDQAVPQAEGGPGGYNDFWVESAGITDQIRTSHIVYPTNGRYPAESKALLLPLGVWVMMFLTRDLYAIQWVASRRMPLKIEAFQNAASSALIRALLSCQAYITTTYRSFKVRTPRSSLLR